VSHLERHFVRNTLPVALAAVFLAGSAFADEAEKPLTDDPRGLVLDAWRPGRVEIDVGQGIVGQYDEDWLEETRNNGIDIFGWWMNAFQTNPVGGIEQGYTYSGLLDFGAELDLERMLDWKGWLFHVSGSWAGGKNLSNDVGSFVPVNAVYSGDSLRFFEMWGEKRWSEDEWSLRFGRLSVGWEYGLDYDINTQYLSAAFRLNIFGLDANAVNFTVIPFANWGTRLRWTPNPSWRFQASVMNGYPRDFENNDEHGLDWSFEPEEDTFIIAESSYQWAVSRTQRKDSPGILPGRVTFGGYYDTGTYETLDASGSMAQDLYTVYVNVRQKVTEPVAGEDQGINLWTVVTYSGRPEIAPVTWFWSGGAVWLGPLKNRPDDTIALGFANSWFSEELSGKSYETTFELAYTYEVDERLNITPDIQYLLQPGGTGDIDNALIVGVLLYLTF
jgi:porin